MSKWERRSEIALLVSQIFLLVALADWLIGKAMS